MPLSPCKEEGEEQPSDGRARSSKPVVVSNTKLNNARYDPARNLDTMVISGAAAAALSPTLNTRSPPQSVSGRRVVWNRCEVSLQWTRPYLHASALELFKEIG
ncbi:hypothetical protein J6590_053263 [Homalodisca vitripennis]|nr:hypothetical protein J6590_053263 [Homalodisca vitripennis]